MVSKVEKAQTRSIPHSLHISISDFLNMSIESFREPRASLMLCVHMCGCWASLQMHIGLGTLNFTKESRLMFHSFDE